MAVVLVAVPGPRVAFTISLALTFGRQIALLYVVGNTIGLVVQLVGVAFSLGSIVLRSV